MSGDYHFEGRRKDGSRWVMCCGKPVTDLDDARRIARKRIEDGDFDRVEIYVYEKRVVEVVDGG